MFFTTIVIGFIKFKGYFLKQLFIILNILFITTFFTACEMDSLFKPSKEELNLKEKELNATIEQNKQKLNLEKEIALAKINSNLEKEKLVTRNKEKENLYKLQLQENQSQLQLQKYLVLLAALIVILIAFGLYVYFNNRRKDKLKAYEDNMEKYFKSKEHEVKVKIANKIIDTIASGNLSEQQENLLISNMDGNAHINSKALKSINNEDIVDALIIEDDPKSSKKKKKKSKKKNKKSKEK